MTMQYITEEKFYQDLLAPYSNGVSSRFVPNPVNYEKDTWRIGFKGIYGQEVDQLVELDPFALELREEDHTQPNAPRHEDAVRYAQWLDEGLQAPPIEVVQGISGTLRVTNGHRRVAAAKLAGRKVMAWVSWLMWTQGSYGQLVPTGLTMEFVN